MRVMATSSGITGSTDRAKVSCTGPRTLATIYPGGHDCPKHTNVEKVLAHPVSGFVDIVGAFAWCRSDFHAKGGVGPERSCRSGQPPLVLNIDFWSFRLHHILKST